MKKIVSLAICAILVLGCVIPARAANDVPEEVLEGTKSVVRILTQYYSKAVTGSGFVIKNEPGEVLFVTNNHVVEGNPESISIWVGEDKMVDAEIVFTTSAKDLCVLKVTEPVDMKPLKLSREEPRHGSAIYVVGYPGAGDVLSDTTAHTSDSATITDGIISAIRTFTIEEGAAPVELLQINAAVNSGNSGGPLFNAQGEVIGVNTYKVNVNSQGIFGAVGISELWRLLEEYRIEIPEETAAEETLPEGEPEEKPFPAALTAGSAAGVLAVILLAAVLTSRKRKTVTLRAYMENHPQGLGVHGAVTLLLPAAIRLRNLHNDGRLHLQISPDSVLISRKGVTLKEPIRQETGRYSVGFAAPEIYKGGGFGIFSDVYSFAAVLYYAVTGKVPANSLQEEAVAKDLEGLEDPAFAQALQKGMAFGIPDRAQSMQELIYSIAAFNGPESAPKAAEPKGETVSETVETVTEEEWIAGPALEELPEEPEQTVLPEEPVKPVQPEEPVQPEKDMEPEPEPQPGENADGKKKRTGKIVLISGLAAAAVIALTVTGISVGIPASRYSAAEKLLAAGEYEEAAAVFTALGDYKDSTERALEAAYGEAEALLKAGEYGKAVAAFSALGGYQDSAVKAKEAAYRKAEALLNSGDYDGAIKAFEALGDYGDSTQKKEEAGKELAYREAEALLSAGDTLGAAKAFGKLRGYRDAWERYLTLRGEITRRETVSTGLYHTVGLKSDGTVVAVGSNYYGQCDVSGWTDIVAVSAGYNHTVGLESDGTVVAVGDNDYGQCDVSDWTDIVAVSAGGNHTVGLKSDGTVVAVGDNDYGQCDVSDWTDIVAVSALGLNTVGLKSDGTVVAVGWNRDGQCDVSGWTDIVAVSAGSNHTVGLKSDGTVVAVGDNDYGQCDVSDWTDIVAVSAGVDHTVGLKSDGTVVAIGGLYYGGISYGECNVSGWTDIVAISAGEVHTVGLKSDGTLVAVGWNRKGRCDVSDWTDIMLPQKRG